MSIYLGNKKLAGTSVKLSHNIGDIFFTKRTDTVLAGAVECNGATYQTTSYTGAGSIGELLSAGKLDYVSLTAYATAIAQTGWCDKIGWDGAGNTAFRVPTITPGHYIIKTQKPTAENNYTWYKLYADGWVEQGGKTSTSTVPFPIIMADTNYTFVRTNGAGRAGTTANELYTSTTNRTTNSIGLSLESAITPVSWEISGMSSITPRTNTRVMIQLFNGATDEAVATCTGVLADLKDLSNITATGKETIAHNAMPSDRYVDLTLGSSDTYYTAPADGYFLVSKTANSGQFLNGYIVPASSTNRLLGASRMASANSIALALFLPARKGQRLYMTYTASGATNYFRFIYAEGVQ